MRRLFAVVFHPECLDDRLLFLFINAIKEKVVFAVMSLGKRICSIS